MSTAWVNSNECQQSGPYEAPSISCLAFTALPQPQLLGTRALLEIMTWLDVIQKDVANVEEVIAESRRIANETWKLLRRPP